MIVFEDVWLYMEDRPVLQGVSFTIRTDERVAILGPSGVGKTTILRLILGLQRVDSGRILIDDADLSCLSERMREKTSLKFSIVFQEGALFDSLSVRENVAFYFREYWRGAAVEKIDAEVSRLLRIVGLEEDADLMPEHLSGGMKRRVAIARALAVSQAEMNLYDEPTSGLDPINADIIRSLIVQLATNGKGFIVVTHEVLDAMLMAKRFLFLKDGGIVFDGDWEAVVKTQVPWVRQFLSPYEKMVQRVVSCTAGAH